MHFNSFHSILIEKVCGAASAWNQYTLMNENIQLNKMNIHIAFCADRTFYLCNDVCNPLLIQYTASSVPFQSVFIELVVVTLCACACVTIFLLLLMFSLQ